MSGVAERDRGLRCPWRGAEASDEKGSEVVFFKKGEREETQSRKVARHA